MSAKRGSMSRKSQTQVELEVENERLKKENANLKKKLKRTIKQLKQYEDIQADVRSALDAEDEAQFEELLKPNAPPLEDDSFVVVLPNGQTKRIKKRVTKS